MYQGPRAAGVLSSSAPSAPLRGFSNFVLFAPMASGEGVTIAWRRRPIVPVHAVA